MSGLGHTAELSPGVTLGPFVCLGQPCWSLGTCMHAKLLQLCPTLWTIACQALLSMGFSRQEYWSGLPCPPPGDLLHPGIEPTSLMSPALAGRFFTTRSTWEAQFPGKDGLCRALTEAVQ